MFLGLRDNQEGLPSGWSFVVVLKDGEDLEVVVGEIEHEVWRLLRLGGRKERVKEPRIGKGRQI
jgi:hypothetical protein